jgi:putative membrane protein
VSALAEYPWRQIVTALHVIAVIAWMAGMLYLPRLFVYHADSAPGSEKSETFKVMERRLLRGIINPAMIATWTFGLLLVFTPGVVDWSRAYPWVKAAAVIAMSALHGNLSHWRKDFEADRNTRPARFFRIVNEVPTALMIIIVITIFVKY